MNLSRFKTWIAAGLVALAGLGGAAAYFAPADPTPTIRLEFTSSETAQERGTVFRTVLASLATLPGSTLDIGPYDYDLGNKVNLPCPEHVTIQGPDASKCALRCRAPVQLTCQFECSNGTVFRDVTLWNDTPDVNDIGVCAGFSQATKTKAPRAIFERCVVIGREHGGYNWGPDNGLIEAWNTHFIGKWGFTAGSGRGPDVGAQCRFYQCTFTGSSRAGTVGGDSGNMVIGLVVRGGFTRAVDCTFESLAYAIENDNPKNPKTTERQACIWLGMPEHRYDAVPPMGDKPGKPAGATWASIDVVNPKTRIVTFDAVKDVNEFVEDVNSYDGGKTKPGRFRVVVSPPQKQPPTFIKQGNVEVFN